VSGPRFDAAFQAGLLRLFQLRRDVRRFRPDPVDPAMVRGLLQTARLAPSVGLSEPWRFVLVDDPERRRRIRSEFARCNAAALAAQPQERAGLYARLKLAGLDQAPCHVAVFADAATEQGHGLGRQTMPEALDYSVVMAVHTLWLAARAAGLGLGWVSILRPAEILRVLEVPASWRFIGYLCLGYPELEADTPELERAGWERRAEAALILQR
jgi:5,6-dimethylbenzimidazole synthase